MDGVYRLDRAEHAAGRGVVHQADADDRQISERVAERRFETAAESGRFRQIEFEMTIGPVPHGALMSRNPDDRPRSLEQPFGDGGADPARRPGDNGNAAG